jgi:GTPase
MGGRTTAKRRVECCSQRQYQHHLVRALLLLWLLLLLLQVLGYDEEGRVLNYVGVATPTPADITAAASHIVNFIDMGGHEKYLKTTLYGMTCLLPGEQAARH